MPLLRAVALTKGTAIESMPHPTDVPLGYALTKGILGTPNMTYQGTCF
jgi:hypothetical protein